MVESAALPIHFIGEGRLGSAQLTPAQASWASANGFTGQRGRLLPLPDEAGQLSGYAFGTRAEANRPVVVGGLASAALPGGRYRLLGEVGDATRAATAFLLGAYRFDRYRQPAASPELELPEGADAAEVSRQVAAATLARDLINTPPNELGPDA